MTNERTPEMDVIAEQDARVRVFRHALITEAKRIAETGKVDFEALRALVACEMSESATLGTLLSRPI